tara:strand:- start:707 stop:1183 length:477 start_codon:yes stop_codon:yes gene_type:complete
MKKNWKIINEIKFQNMNECVTSLINHKYIVSHWIIDIAKKIKTEKNKIKLPVELVRVKVSELGINEPTTLKNIYKLLDQNLLIPIDPLIAVNLRFLYDEQMKGEWLRIAVPFDSMIDSDGVPHLPKLGHALNLFFIETYWSYPDAIFHPHNEFVVQKK